MKHRPKVMLHFSADFFNFLTSVHCRPSDPPLTVIGPEWFTDFFKLSPGANALLTLFAGEHMLGGITDYNAAETTDENPARLALICEVVLAYLRMCLRKDGIIGRVLQPD